MNKKPLLFILFFALALSGALYYSTTLQSPFINTVNRIQIAYNNATEMIKKTAFEYFFQTRHIAELGEKLKEYETRYTLSYELEAKLKDLISSEHLDLAIDPQIKLVQAISYQKFGDFNRLWIDVKDYDHTKIYGLIYKDMVAGIVIPDERRALALLIGDIKSTYAVCIGDGVAQGIAMGNNSEEIIIKYIPAWQSIAVDDEVVTSGLDGIFFKNLKVGRVTSISKSQGYQSATVKPYFNKNDPTFFYLISPTP